MKSIKVNPIFAILILIIANISFSSDSIPPFIISTAPINNEMHTGLNKLINIKFSEQIDTSRFYYTITPFPGGVGKVWTSDSTSLNITHDLFSPSTTYKVVVDSSADTSGNIMATDSFCFTTGGSSQKIVVAEDFTATWCSFCPDAAKALDSIYRVAEDSFIIIAYHPSGTDPFQTQASVDRANYYALEFYPTVFFNGGYTTSSSTLVGSFGANTYDSCRIRYDSIKEAGSSLEMAVNYLNYDDISKSGQMEVKAKNTSAFPLNGTVQFLVLERGIPYAWQTMDELDFLVRDMLPDAGGEAVSIPAGDSISVTRNFNIGSDWAFGNCHFVAFVQTADHQITQAAQAFGPSLVLEHKTLSEVTGNNNGFYEPGETGNITVWVKNKWADAQGARVRIASADTFINITNDMFTIGNMTEGDTVDNQSMPFEFQVLSNANMAEGHLVTVKIFCELYHPGLSDTAITFVDSVRFQVGSPNTIYFEDFESGLGSWATGYVGNFAVWDTIDSDYYSSNHCITDSKGGNYPNTSSHWIQMTSGIDLRPYSTASLSWWEKYYTDDTGDRCRLERSLNGGANWSEIQSHYGVQPAWTKRTVDLTNFCGDTISNFRLRFKMTSNSSLSADGWYVDDVMILGYTKTGVSSDDRPLSPIIGMKLEQNYPNPFNRNTSIRFALSASSPVKLNVYDITGRLVRNIADGVHESGSYSIVWDGRDNNGRRMGNGVYFYRLDAGGGQKTMKAVLVQ